MQINEYSKFMESFIEEQEIATKEIESIMKEYDISFCFIGGMALNHYQYHRMTDDIDILIDCKDKEKLKNIPTGYIRDVSVNQNWKKLRLIDPKVNIDVIFSGEKSGDGINGITFETPEKLAGTEAFISLFYLIIYKISSYLYGKRNKDKSDVIALIQKYKLEKGWLDGDEYPVREDIKKAYESIWKEANEEITELPESYELIREIKYSDSKDPIHAEIAQPDIIIKEYSNHDDKKGTFKYNKDNGTYTNKKKKHGVRANLKKKEAMGKVHGITVYRVDGEEVREKCYPDFTMGGNSAIYDFIPHGEIWVEDMKFSFDEILTFIHELTEDLLMTYDGETYDQAHDSALEAEILVRKLMGEKDTARNYDESKTLLTEMPHIRWKNQNIDLQLEDHPNDLGEWLEYVFEQGVIRDKYESEVFFITDEEKKDFAHTLMHLQSFYFMVVASGKYTLNQIDEVRELLEKYADEPCPW